MVMLMDSVNRLKAENCKMGEQIKILTEGSWIVDTYKGKDGAADKDVNSFVISIEHNGAPIDLRVTKASRENLKEAWGKDTASWVGKKAGIMIVPTEKGKSIMLTPVLGEEAWK